MLDSITRILFVVSVMFHNLLEIEILKWCALLSVWICTSNNPDSLYSSVKFSNPSLFISDILVPCCCCRHFWCWRESWIRSFGFIQSFHFLTEWLCWYVGTCYNSHNGAWRVRGMFHGCFGFCVVFCRRYFCVLGRKKWKSRQYKLLIVITTILVFAGKC